MRLEAGVTERNRGDEACSAPASKPCRKCARIKPLSDFRLKHNGDGRTSRRSYCVECVRKEGARYNEEKRRSAVPKTRSLRTSKYDESIPPGGLTWVVNRGVQRFGSTVPLCIFLAEKTGLSQESWDRWLARQTKFRTSIWRADELCTALGIHLSEVYEEAI